VSRALAAMRRSDITKECGNCPRRFFRLFNEQHMRRAWQHGEMRRRYGVRYSLNNWWRRGFVAFARNTDRRHINLWKSRQGVDVPHGVPSGRPAIRIVREKSFTHSFVLACRAERGGKPTIQGRFKYISHSVAPGIVAALPGDCTALRYAVQAQIASALVAWGYLSANTIATMPPKEKPTIAAGSKSISCRSICSSSA
jgi:hypothetical protein